MNARLMATLRPAIDRFVAACQRAPGQARLTSWGRTVAHNAAVGGAPDSQHLIWTAADWVPQGSSTNASIAAALRAQGLIVIDEGDHVHAQLFTASAVAPFIRAARERGLL